MNENNQNGVCPECGNTNINYGVLEPTDSGIMYQGSCCDCECEFEEHYTIEYSETIIK